MSRDTWLSHLEVLLASSGEMPGVLLNFLKSTGQSPNDRLIWPQMSVVPGCSGVQLAHTGSTLRETRII